MSEKAHVFKSPLFVGHEHAYDTYYIQIDNDQRDGKIRTISVPKDTDEYAQVVFEKDCQKLPHERKCHVYGKLITQNT